MAWRIAKALLQLRDQIDAKYPGRTKKSDGSIGDEEHATRNSDHNPWVKDGSMGVVTAIDITHDPAHGLSARSLAESIIETRDRRIKYVISNNEICSGTDQDKPAWKWRPYTGSNPHTHHFHISVKPEKKFYDDATRWGTKGAPPAEVPAPDLPMLRKGVVGDDVATLQRLLNKNGAKLREDGVFGEKTKAAVVKFQKANGLVADGVVGSYTWEALGAQTETPLIGW